MVLPTSSSSSRLSSFRKTTPTKTKQTGISDYLKKHTSFLPQHIRAPSHSTATTTTTTTTTTATSSAPSQKKSVPDSAKSTVQSNKILDGVVACLDVRTEDGDDVSQNFERSLQSMGAKTRRTFSDSVTHLIFKNGSPATLKKAISKNVFIINLLWISRCLVLAGKKRRKSMEPGKVRALGALETSLSSSSESGNEDSLIEESYSGFIEPRRRTIATTNWIPRESSESMIRKRHIAEAEQEDESTATNDRPRLSLPLSVESIASRHTSKKQKASAINTIPVIAPSKEMKEQIKARFSIGKSTSQSTEEEATRLMAKSSSSSSLISQSQTNDTSLSSHSNTNTIIKRKRKLTGLFRPNKIE
ncbi:hypothetical protein A0J61_06642 [Choanephora cucurbitarum]|uniref:BRCT domain-containing protein n=1 Tax=Choanephora cucurbitarum TaxID=101091 RepID=A0A1C7N866_9FUNG|nr:hypothetical protein A0J61_06642 [Choanephora cucurbitarum]